MMVGVLVLTDSALGAFSWRTHRDPLLFLLVMLSTAALFMTTPYVGYLDNITVLYFLSLILAFFLGRNVVGRAERPVPVRRGRGVYAPDHVRDLRLLAGWRSSGCAC